MGRRFLPWALAQAAAWHICNGMSWEELAAKKINRLGRPDEPFFTLAQLKAASQVTAAAEKLAACRSVKSDSSSQN